jgi:glucose/arabinose dehydrogenase
LRGPAARVRCSLVRLHKVLATIVLGLALGSAVPAAAAAVRLVELGRFREPVYVTGVGDRLVVVERRGRIRELRRGRARPFADLRSRVVVPGADETVDQRGLFSVAFPPDYRISGRYYADYVDRGGRLRVDELRRGRLAARRVLDLGPAALQHHGGQLQFGPDGLLYVSTGIGDDPSASGTVLRLDPRRGGAPEVYADGLRNPWRFSFDRGSGALVIGDVGEAVEEEVNVIPAGSPAGVHFGWPYLEGVTVRDGTPPAGLTAPALVRPHGPSSCALIGGYVVRGRGPRSLGGRYVYGDLCSGELRSARLAGPALVDDRPLGVRLFYLTSFGEDAAGRLYGVSFGGVVYRIVD